MGVHCSLPFSFLIDESSDQYQCYSKYFLKILNQVKMIDDDSSITNQNLSEEPE